MSEEREVVGGTFPIWDFKSEGPGAVLEGEVANITDLNFGDRVVRRAIIVNDKGQKLSVLLTAVLESAFRNGDITLTDRIRITYNGEKKSPHTKRTYHDFTVEKYKRKE